MRYEVVFDSLAGQQQEVEKLIQTFHPMVFVRHYSFVNLEDFGYPDQLVDWFNVVRHPVEKVISYFYYRRAPWKLKLERQNFPDLPMPSEARCLKITEKVSVNIASEANYVLHFECIKVNLKMPKKWSNLAS